MSIILLGYTKCAICHKVIGADDRYFQFPAFINNIFDDLYFLNDESCHIHCLEDCSLGKIALNMARQSLLSVTPSNRICAIQGNTIEKFENDLYLGFFTSDSEQALYQYNFKHFDKRNIRGWAGLRNLITNLNELHESGMWKEQNGYSSLLNMINLLSSFTY